MAAAADALSRKLDMSLEDLIKSSSKGSRGSSKAAGGIRGKLGKKKGGQKVVFAQKTKVVIAPKGSSKGLRNAQGQAPKQRGGLKIQAKPLKKRQQGSSAVVTQPKAAQAQPNTVLVIKRPNGKLVPLQQQQQQSSKRRRKQRQQRRQQQQQQPGQQGQRDTMIWESLNPVPQQGGGRKKRKHPTAATVTNGAGAVQVTRGPGVTGNFGAVRQAAPGQLRMPGGGYRAQGFASDGYQPVPQRQGGYQQQGRYGGRGTQQRVAYVTGSAPQYYPDDGAGAYNDGAGDNYDDLAGDAGDDHYTVPAYDDVAVGAPPLRYPAASQQYGGPVAAGGGYRRYQRFVR